MTVICSQGFFTTVISGSLMNATEGKDLAHVIDNDPAAEVVEADGDPAIEIVGDGFVEQESGLAVSQRRNPPIAYCLPAEIADSVLCGVADFFSFFLPVEFAGNNVGELRAFFSSAYEQCTTPEAVWKFEDALDKADWKAAEEALTKDSSPRFLDALRRELPYSERRKAPIPARMIEKVLRSVKECRRAGESLRSLVRLEHWSQVHEVIQAMIGLRGSIDSEPLKILMADVQYSLSQHVWKRGADNIPLEILSGGCRLGGGLAGALPVFRGLLRRCAELCKTSPEAWQAVDAALPDICSLERRSYGEQGYKTHFGNPAPGDPDYVYDESMPEYGGVLSDLLPYVRSRQLPREILVHALECGCGSAHDLHRLCDLLFQQQDWETLESLIGRGDCARYFIDRAVARNAAYRGMAIPAELIERAMTQLTRRSF